ncbi:MAG: substrate-binding domain-containing protein, partial [Sediminibacterium sp.]
GTIHISVDESFKPVMEQQIKVHHSSFPNTKIEVSYKSEADCFRDLQQDSTRMVIVARGLNKQEDTFFENQLSYPVLYGELAYDAVAIIYNRAGKDSVFNVEKLRKILSGQTATTVVMDGNSATSTVRYLRDTILHGAPFGSNVVAAKNSEDVLVKVAERADAIGFVGLSWIGDSYNVTQLEYLKKVNLGLVECTKCEEKGLYARPSQATISRGQYALSRPVYYILKENATGLGTGFMNFMSHERGQLIFRRASLVPAKMGFSRRTGTIKNAD